jgi:hypothetical protein
MRWSLLLLVGGLAACLYVGGINHEPEGEIQLGTSLLQYGEHGEAVLFASASDPDEDPLTYAWRVKVTDLKKDVHALNNAKARFDLVRGDNLEALSTGMPPVIGTEEKLTLKGLPAIGTYEVTLTITDEQGAQRLATRIFKVDNLPPKVTLLITADPDFTKQKVPDSEYADKKLRYPGHAHYMVRVVEDPINNPEGDLTCGSKASISYSVEPSFKAKMASWTTKPCQGKEWLDRLSFRLQDDAITAASTKLTVKAVIKDGIGGTSTAVQSIELQPNRPPCILATNPDFLAVGASEQAVVSVLADEPRSFAVTTPSEDVNTGLRYSWWVKDASGGTFEPILEGAAGGELSLPAWFRLPGESVELRVIVQEAKGAAPTCPAQMALCLPGGEELPDKCYRWVTWKVKFI